MDEQRPMQFGRRTQNLTANRSDGKRAQASVSFNVDRDQAAVAPASPARLEAEAAFSGPQFWPIPASQAQVTVRRSRLLVVAVVAEQAKAEDAPPVEPSVQGPRVFRVGAARSAPTAAAAQATRPAVTKHKRRLAVSKRPGKVFHVVQAQPAASTLELLGAELASVTPVLESIKRAQSFWFIDDRFAKDWQRLSKLADALLAKLQALRRQA